METAYENLLSAYEALDSGFDEERSNKFKWCEERVRLYGTQKTVDAITKLKTTQPMTPERTEAHNELMEAMRKDLGSQKK